MNTKVVIIVLVVVALLFVLVLVAGAGRKRDTTADTDNSTWAQLLKKLYKEERVEPSEVQGNCLKGDMLAITQGSTCVLTVAATDVRAKAVRTAALRLLQGVEAKASYTPGSGKDKTKAGETKNSDDPLAMPLSLKLKPGRETKFQVMEQGGTLQLTCSNGVGTPALCIIRLS